MPNFVECFVICLKVIYILSHPLQPIAQAVKSYMENTNDFRKKLCPLPKLPNVIIILLWMLQNRIQTYRITSVCLHQK